MDAPYSVQLTALTGPGGADLTVAVAVDPASQCTVPDVLTNVQLKTFDPAERFAWVRDVTDVPAPGGVANLDLGLIPHDRRIDAEVLVQTGTPDLTFVFRGTTKTLLRPDLVVQEITPKQALVGTQFNVEAVIAERNGDVGASADVTLSAIPGAVEHVDVAPGGSTTVSFPVTFDSPVPVELTATVGGAVPTETDVTNNALTATIDITGHQLASPFRVLFPSLLGYGAQFDNHLYAPITPLAAGQDTPTSTRRSRRSSRSSSGSSTTTTGTRTRTGTSRTGRQLRVVRAGRAARAGAGRHDRHRLPEPEQRRDAQAAAGRRWSRFADVLADLVNNHGLTNVRWAEVANEPNSGVVTLDQYKALYRALNAELVARGLGDQIQIMGGGLVENAGNPARDHYSWMELDRRQHGRISSAGTPSTSTGRTTTPGRLEYRLRDT